MKSFILLICGMFISISLLAQSKASTEPVYEFVEQMPEFKGGEDALANYLAKHMHYPRDASRNHIMGRVITSFVIDTAGHIDSVKVVQGAYPSLDAEALRVIKMMPPWKPGKQNGQVVRVRFSLPIVFELQER